MQDPKRILILQGHPDPAGGHLCHALAGAYAEGARESGHTVEVVTIAALDFPMLRTQAEWTQGELPPAAGPRPLQTGFRTAAPRKAASSR